MEPLSITSSALGVAANVLRTAFIVKEAIDQLRDAPEIVRDIEDEITITQAALRQVEAALGHDPEVIWRFRLDDVFDISVKGCLDTLQRIDEEFESFFGRDDWRARLGIWWNSGDIRCLLGRLGAKKGGLMLLVQALSLRSVQEMQNLLQQNRATLDIARRGLEDMVPTYPAYKDKDFDSPYPLPFDEICFGSKAYQRAVARVSSKKALQLRRKDSMPVRESYIPSVAESEAESENEPSGETATPTAPTVVESAVHEAVCFKLQEAEARIRALEERIHQTPVAQLKNEASQEQLRLNAQMRKRSLTSKPKSSKQATAEDTRTIVEPHETEEDHDKSGYLHSESYDRYNEGGIPSSLKYVPYQSQHRGLSPIPESSEYTAGSTKAPVDADEIYPSDSISSLGKPRLKDAVLSSTSVSGHTSPVNIPSSVPGVARKVEAPFTPHHTEADTRRTTKSPVNNHHGLFDNEYRVADNKSAGTNKPDQIASDPGKKDRRRRQSKAQDADSECKKISEEGGPFLAAMLGKDNDESASDVALTVKQVPPKGGRKIKINDLTDLLIEYFEGGKDKASGDVRRPSVRVKVTPALKEQRQADDVQISKARTARRRSALPSAISAITAKDTQSDGNIPLPNVTHSGENTVDSTDHGYRDMKATDRKTRSKEPRARTSKTRTSGLAENTRDKGRSKGSLARLAAWAEREEIPDADVRSGISHWSSVHNQMWETVEDAIRRLILPELNALKREQSESKMKVNGDRLKVTEPKDAKGAVELGLIKSLQDLKNAITRLAAAIP